MLMFDDMMHTAPFMSKYYFKQESEDELIYLAYASATRKT